MAAAASATLGQSTRVAGCQHFFFSHDLKGPWRHEEIRVRSKRTHQRENYVAIRVTTFQDLPKQQKGCLAMVSQNLRWRLVVISKVTDTERTGFFVDELGAANVANPVNLDFSRFFYICLFSRKEDFLNSLQHPARINEIDGCLEAALSPSIVDYRKFVPSLPMVEEKGKGMRRRGKRGRGGPKKTTIRSEDLWCKFLTIYFYNMNFPYPVGEKDTVVVPSLETSSFPDHEYFVRREYSLVRKSDVKSLDLAADEFEATRRAMSLTTFHLLQIECELPLRFVLVQRNEFQSLQLPLISTNRVCAKYEVSQKGNLAITGVVVSIQTTKPDLPTFQLSDLYTSLDCHGVTSFQRLSTPHLGYLQFHGPRRSTRVHLSPESGPGPDHFEREHYRANFQFDDQRVTFLKKLRHAARSVKVLAAKMAPNYLNFVGLKTCDRLIWSQGVLRKKIERVDSTGESTITWRNPQNGCLGYANCPHLDEMDLVPQDKIEEWMDKIEECPSKTKLQSYADRIGIGLPTTCGYNHVGDPCSFEVTAHFGLSQFAFPLRHQLVHHFYAWAVPHFTCVPLLSSDLRVRVTNKDYAKQFSVVAWGDSGGYWHARARREAAKKAKQAAQQRATQQQATQQRLNSMRLSMRRNSKRLKANSKQLNSK